jgi:hypothetical protein
MLLAQGKHDEASVVLAVALGQLVLLLLLPNIYLSSHVIDRTLTL